MSPHASPKRAFGKTFAFLCLASLSFLPARAAEPVKRAFDLPAADAAVTLKAFAEQSGREIVYAVDAVRGTRTNAVKGELLPQEALELMLAGTDLMATQSKGGLLAVKKAPDPKDQRAAQTTAPSARPNKEEVTELAKFTVTGSNIPTAANATSSPVTILGSKQIDQAGVNANMLELLRKRLPSITGRSNIGAANANNVNQITLGGSQIALRNLDTLVLINGRRVATNGANGIRGRNFVDVNQIPVAAVERVEILTDGASAIYGSDAVGGVVNFILKSDYQGAEAGGRMAWATGNGNYTERSAYVVAGAGQKGVSVTVSGNWTKNTPLFQKDRPFSQSITGRNATIAGAIGSGTVFPTHFLNPTLNSPSQTNPTGSNATATSLNALVANGTYVPSDFATIAATFDSALYTTLLLGQEQKTALVNASADLFGKKLVAFGSAILGKTDSSYQLPAQTTTFTEPARAPFNPLTVAFPRIGFSYLPAPIQYTENSKSNWASGGLRGELGPRWNWEAAYTYNDNRISQRQKNVYYTPNLTRALAGGFDAAGNAVAGGAYSRVIAGFSEATGSFVFQPALDPFARAAAVNPASLANLLGTAVIAVGSKLDSTDLKLVGTPFNLPAGEVGLAVGGSTRKEEVFGQPDENSYVSGPTAARWTGAGTFDPFDQSRRIDSGFAEVRIPVTSPAWNFRGARVLDLSLAYRMEKYSDVGNSSVPKYSVRWQPVDESLTLRYTYAKSFTAPGLYFLFGPSNQTLTTAATVPTALGFPGQANNLTTNNPDLKPSTAVTQAAGLVFSPKGIKNLTLTVDYISADQKGVVGGPGAGVTLSTTDRLGAASPYLGNVALNNFPGRPGAVAITQVHQLSDLLRNGGSASSIYLTSNFINLSGAKVRAFDVNVDYELHTENLGKFDFNSAATIFQSYRFKALPEQPYYEYVGYATNGGTGQQGTIPRYRLYSVVDWNRGPWRVMVGNTFVPGVTDIGVGGDTYANSTTIKATPVASYASWDLQFGYTFAGKSTHRWIPRNTKLTLGVNNVFDRMPPSAPQAFTDSSVDPSTYGLIGRLIFVSTAVKF
ncbi:TonB-dependent receptor [Opitutus sp. GAS368]|uniref:TonB-dependent receptor n=1 Tax=Opitutus sp. GAS368 TaxID=1882749 RepID=UPI00087AEEB3|nr:TonB-dependent receptor [Opitutus sp. GAS368]SDS37569.1 iron complex outermembrane recepter protein [Opitutus sp. GAS368]